VWTGVVGFSRCFVEFINEHEEFVEFSFAVWIGTLHYLLPSFTRRFRCMCRGGLGFVGNSFLVIVWRWRMIGGVVCLFVRGCGLFVWLGVFVWICSRSCTWIRRLRRVSWVGCGCVLLCILFVVCVVSRLGRGRLGLGGGVFLLWTETRGCMLRGLATHSLLIGLTFFCTCFVVVRVDNMSFLWHISKQ